MSSFKKVSVVMFVLSVCLILTPLITLAADTEQPLAQLAGCTGADCGACNVVSIANGLVKWLIGFVFLLFALLMSIAGVRLVMSAGNPGALQSAKDKFINALIGFLIILAAWLIIDTLMRSLVGTEGHDGELKTTGAADGWLFWSNIECVAQPTVSEGEVEYVNLNPGVDTVVPMPPIVDPSYPAGHDYTLSLPDGTEVPIAHCDSSAMVSVPFLGSSVQIHRNLAASARRIDAAWRARGGHSFYRVTSVGGYNCRNTASGDRSFHSYGLAIDINPAQNPHCPTWPACNGQNILITDMPPAFVSLFLAEGWGWGGNWRSSKDAMHFSKGNREGGDMRGE